MSAPRPAYVLAGARVGLTPLREELVDRYARWWSDPEVKRGIANLGLHTPHTQAAWLAAVVPGMARPRPESAQFTVHDLADGEPVGLVALFEVDWANRRCELWILLGERRGQGLGTEAVRLAVGWAFEVLGLHNVLLTAMAPNAGAIKAYERAGFRHVGVRRGGFWLGGEPVDVVLMDVVRTDPLPAIDPG
jgi:diamine N-acetyltransferase